MKSKQVIDRYFDNSGLLIDKLEILPVRPLNSTTTHFFDDGYTYKTYPVKAVFFHLSLLLSNGIILNLRRGFVKDSIMGMIFLANFDCKFFLRKIFFHRIQILRDNIYLSFFDDWSSNHYHFHCDLLPRLLLLEADQTRNLILILPDNPYIQKVAIPILNYLNIAFKEVILIRPQTNYFIFRNLLYLSKSHLSGQTHPLLMAKIQDRINTYFPVSRSGNPEKRFYIKRGAKYGRQVLNEAEVIEFLIMNYGFEVVDFDELDIASAIRLMREAHILIGMHGAALTNMVYMPVGGFVFEFRHDGVHNNHCYWHLASSMGLHYTAIFGIPDQADKLLEGNGCNLTIPINILESSLTTYSPFLMHICNSNIE